MYSRALPTYLLFKFYLIKKLGHSILKLEFEVSRIPYSPDWNTIIKSISLVAFND